MKVKFGRLAIEIIPENPQDEIYLESLLNLHKKGDQAIAERVSLFGLDHTWAYLEIKRARKNKKGS